MGLRHWIATSLLAWSAVSWAEQPIAFRTWAKVEIDATGAIAQVTPAPGLPQIVGDAVRSQVAQWKFEPTMQDGIAKPATTYARLNGCAVYDAGQMTLAFDYRGDGPQIKGGTSLPPLRYPDAAIKRSGTDQALAALTFVVETDGKVTLEDIDYKRLSGRRKVFDEALNAWLGTLQFLPQEIAGKPIRTRARVLVNFGIDDDSNPDERIASNPKKSRACIAADASQDGLDPVAMDSPIKRIPPG